MCELKVTHWELKSDTHWRNWLCFQQKYIRASNRAFTVQTRYTHTGTGWCGRRRGVNKGNDRGETGRGQLVSALFRIRHTCSLHDKTRLEYRRHFVLTICQCEPSHLLASLAESDYCWLLSHSVSAETCNPIYPIPDMPVQWMNTHRYTISVYLYKLVQLHSAVLETIFDFCESKTRTIKYFHNQIFENRLTTLFTMYIMQMQDLAVEQHAWRLGSLGFEHIYWWICGKFEHRPAHHWHLSRFEICSFEFLTTFLHDAITAEHVVSH